MMVLGASDLNWKNSLYRGGIPYFFTRNQCKYSRPRVFP
ncbi:hypothetical protein C4K14_2296 [Pseudomonas chlororaphis subsp. aureofaciens]|nr:hypothetical protein C4K14_2296 [Pseudomonas chlororaphis subsp. aureofaciens]